VRLALIDLAVSECRRRQNAGIREFSQLPLDGTGAGACNPNDFGGMKFLVGLANQQAQDTQLHSRKQRARKTGGG